MAVSDNRGKVSTCLMQNFSLPIHWFLTEFLVLQAQGKRKSPSQHKINFNVNVLLFSIKIVKDQHLALADL